MYKNLIITVLKSGMKSVADIYRMEASFSRSFYYARILVTHFTSNRKTNGKTIYIQTRFQITYNFTVMGDWNFSHRPNKTGFSSPMVLN